MLISGQNSKREPLVQAISGYYLRHPSSQVSCLSHLLTFTCQSLVNSRPPLLARPSFLATRHSILRTNHSSLVTRRFSLDARHSSLRYYLMLPSSRILPSFHVLSITYQHYVFVLLSCPHALNLLHFRIIIHSSSNSLIITYAHIFVFSYSHTLIHSYSHTFIRT